MEAARHLPLFLLFLSLLSRSITMSASALTSKAAVTVKIISDVV
jgi:hypothetical protein